MFARKIVHITPTPLVGAPGKIAWAQRKKGHDSIAVALNDYPKSGPLEGKFLAQTLIIDEFTREYIETKIREADVIHVHNYLPNERAEWLSRLNQDACYLYQAHSPLREGPLYVARAEEYANFDYKVKLVVGQHWGRFYPSYLPVPNLILNTPSLRLRRDDEVLKIMFSPTHKHEGRWTSKFSKGLEDALDALSKLKKIEVVSPTNPASPETLFELRRSCHVTIDEIATGGFHMVSLEGLCAGNIVINRADYFSKATFSGFCNGNFPPFIYADDRSISCTIEHIAKNPELTRKLQQESFDYFSQHCDPLKLIEVFDAAYATAN